MSGGFKKLNGKDGKPFVKGDPRINRKGRPKQLPDLKELLCSVLGEESQGKTAMERILLTMRDRAIKGDVKASEMLKNWGYGKDIDFQKIDLNLEQFNEDSLLKICDKLIQLENEQT